MTHRHMEMPVGLFQLQKDEISLQLTYNLYHPIALTRAEWKVRPASSNLIPPTSIKHEYPPTIIVLPYPNPH